MSIEFDLRIWDGSKADERWLAWLELSPEERKESEPQEQVESVLEIMEQDNAPVEWRKGRLAMLDLAFGQMGESLRIRDFVSYESLARFLLVSFADCPAENGELPSPRLMLHPLYYERLLETVDEEAIRSLVTPALFAGEKLTGLRRLLEPLEIPNDPSFAHKIADALIDFWKLLEPFFREAIEIDKGRGSVVIIDAVNGEVDNPLFAKRAVQHEQWLRGAM